RNSDARASFECGSCRCTYGIWLRKFRISTDSLVSQGLLSSEPTEVHIAQTGDYPMEQALEQFVTILIYAPIPVTILWLLIGAAFSKANRSTTSQSEQNSPDSPRS
ncbi:MAG TPA: hypothetical protein VFZ34_29395, partial [Blastocatellia bacterium]|nr:hypothetical protein [Blastocatellia bacterium]